MAAAGPEDKVVVCSYPEWAPLTELEHPEHSVLKLHRAVELGQVVVVDTQQLEHEGGDEEVEGRVERDGGVKKGWMIHLSCIKNNKL